MKTVLAISIGFFIARQIYINMDKSEARKKEKAVEKKLKDFLTEKGLSPKEIKQQSKEILGV